MKSEKIFLHTFSDFTCFLSEKKMQNNQLRVRIGRSCWRFEKRGDENSLGEHK